MLNTEKGEPRGQRSVGWDRVERDRDRPLTSPHPWIPSSHPIIIISSSSSHPQLRCCHSPSSSSSPPPSPHHCSLGTHCLPITLNHSHHFSTESRGWWCSPFLDHPIPSFHHPIFASSSSPPLSSVVATHLARHHLHRDDISTSLDTHSYHRVHLNYCRLFSQGLDRITSPSIVAAAASLSR
jgi:hypothetical protein